LPFTPSGPPSHRVSSSLAVEPMKNSPWLYYEKTRRSLFLARPLLFRPRVLVQPLISSLSSEIRAFEASFFLPPLSPHQPAFRSLEYKGVNSIFFCPSPYVCYLSYLWNRKRLVSHTEYLPGSLFHPPAKGMFLS